MHRNDSSKGWAIIFKGKSIGINLRREKWVIEIESDIFWVQRQISKHLLDAESILEALRKILSTWIWTWNCISTGLGESMSLLKQQAYLYIYVFLGALMLFQDGMAFEHNAKGSETLPIVFQDTSSVDSKNLKALQVEVESLLPPLMLRELKRQAPPSGYQLSVNDLPRNAMGSSNREGSVVLAPALFKLDRLQQQKVLIHEWAHQFDFLNTHSPERLKTLQWCRRFDPGVEQRRLNPSAAKKCDILRDIKSSVSTTPEFLEVGGWSLSTDGKGKREQKSHFTYRSLDIYEIQSPAEMFAVNMEAFLTDAEFSCRRPTMNFYLSSYFGYRPFGERDCSKDYRLVSPHFNSAEKALVAIDKKRLYQIHYLVAGPGDGVAAQFGHSMYRFVMCAPHRRTMGPDCIKDIQHHFVLSYRAFIDSPQISYLAGLGGDYPSKLFFLPFAQVIEEYNKTELRDLKSYPLQLTEAEKSRLFDRAFEVHWSYNGRYYFLSKNCAVESLNLLRSSTLRPELMDRSATTPFGMLDLLTSVGLIKKGYFHDESWALANGYLFRSHGESLEQALSLIQEKVASAPADSVESWKQLGGVERREIFQRVVKTLSRTEKVKVAAAFLLLENWISRSHSSQLLEALLNSSVETSTFKNFLDAKMGFRSTEDLLTTPARLAIGGYGIPRPQEHEMMMSRFADIAWQRAQMKETLSTLTSMIVPTSLNAMDVDIRQNRELFHRELLAAAKRTSP